MKTKPLLAVLVALFLVACHPSASEKQDVLDGEAFTQNNLTLGHVAEKYLNFVNSGEFLNHSKYFKAGADYRALVILNQADDNWAKVDNSNEDAETQKVMANDKQILENVCSVAWVTLQQDLRAIQLTPAKFGDIVGDTKLPTLMASNPYQSTDN